MQVHEPTASEAVQNFERFVALAVSHRDFIDMEEYANSWFCGASFEEVWRENMADLLSYGFWYRCVSQQPAAGQCRGGPYCCMCRAAVRTVGQIGL